METRTRRSFTQPFPLSGGRAVSFFNSGNPTFGGWTLARTRNVLLLIAATALLTVSCSRAGESLRGESFTLVDQNGDPFRFPEDMEGKTVLAGYIYTHCPDICPMVTYKMRDVERTIDSSEFMLLSFSFDPRRDTPQVLADYAQSYKLDTDRWRLLTGEPKVVEQIMQRLQISVQKLPSRFLSDGSEMYFVNHSDKVTLIDLELRIVDEFVGSELDQEEVINLIQRVLSP